MTLVRKARLWYGDCTADLQVAVVDYSAGNTYVAAQFCSPVCACGSSGFRLQSDENEGVAQRTCANCAVVTLMGDSDEYAHSASFDSHECLCDADVFELLSAVALYSGSNDVRWYYIGCRCLECGLLGVYVDYKCEAGDVGAFLEKT